MAFRIGKVLFCCCLLYLKAIKAPGLIMPDCNSMDCNLPGSSDHGILQARILEWVTVPSSRGCLPPGDVPDTGNEPSSLMSLAFAGKFFTTNITLGHIHIFKKHCFSSDGHTHTTIYKRENR